MISFMQIICRDIPALQRKSSARRLGLAATVAGGIALAAAGVQASDNDRVQVSSLEVKSRIASMEQVNVTAEKEIDESAPVASAAVERLLAELEAEEAAESHAEPVAQ